MWKFIKDNTIKNKVFETLKILEDEVDEQLALHKEEELKKIKDNPKPTKKETPKQSSFDFPEDEYLGCALC